MAIQKQKTWPSILTYRGNVLARENEDLGPMPGQGEEFWDVGHKYNERYLGMDCPSRLFLPAVLGILLQFSLPPRV